MLLDQAARTYSDKMWSTITATYRSGIGYFGKEKKISMVHDDHKLGDSLKKLGTHKCGPDTNSDIAKVKFVNIINYG